MGKSSENLALSDKEIRIFASCAAGAGMLTGLLFYGNPLAGLVLTAGFVFFFPVYKKTVIEKKRSQRLVQFRDMLYSVSSSVSAGRTMGQALEESVDFWKSTYGPDDYIMKELDYMTRQIKEGNEKDSVVLRQFAERSGLEDAADFAAVYESCRITGGDLPKAINRATSIIGDKINLERELKTLMAQKRFESRIVMGSPFVLILLLKIMAPDYLKPMTGTREGVMIMTFALGLMAAAVVMMERINNIEI